MNRLSGKVALVTGGGSGIGRAIAEAFAAQGGRVVVVDIDGGRAERTAATITSAGGSAIGVTGDVTSSDSVEAAFAACVAAYSGVDILVNSAGMGQLGTVTDLDQATWDRVMTLNVGSIFLCSKAAIPLMVARGGGRIINIASVSGITASAGRAVYTASKGAVVMLTRAMALDHAGQRINVNAICPGVVVTAMTEASLKDPATMRQKLDDTPLGRLADPREIAPAAVYLASADGSFVTGSSLVVDGGWCA
jgi:NAD(P)-dependent dehydrogenase (short-subunit alcohol dehydrogenase family)